MAKISVDCIFDINCPWCYIGHTKFHKAVRQFTAKWPSDSIQTKLIPFYLQPPPQLTAPETPPFPVATRPRRQLRLATYGPIQAPQAVQRIKESAAAEGLYMKFDGLTGTTRNGHRLVYHAGKLKGDEAAEQTLMALFKRYHEQEVDITKLDVLVEVGVEVGLVDAQEMKRYLLSGEDGQAVDRLADAEILDRRKEGATVGHAGGVPRFLVQGKWEVVGAKESTWWLNMLEKAREDVVAQESG